MSLTRPSKLAHVVYRTRRFDEMLQWYSTVFEAKVQYQNPALAFLTFDDEHHRFALANMAVLGAETNDEGAQGELGVDHLGYSYPSLRALLENFDFLKERGITPYWCIHHGITAALYYADPDGNQMEFQVDCLSSGAEASRYMADNFARNPIGVEFDPADWLARLRAGAPESQLLHRTSHEPVSPIRGAFTRFLRPS
jgi:catechol-2,3-dioxygenase